MEENHISIPSEKQTRNYLNYFTRAHSWYKHLSWTECTYFHFFINPEVPKESVIVQKSSFLKKEVRDLVITDETLRQIELYGHWSYCREQDYQYYSHLMGATQKIGLTAFIHGSFSDPKYPEYYANHLEERAKLEAHLFKIINA